MMLVDLRCQAVGVFPVATPGSNQERPVTSRCIRGFECLVKLIELGLVSLVRRDQGLECHSNIIVLNPVINLLARFFMQAVRHQ